MTDTMLHTKAEVLRESTKVEEGVIDAVVGSTNIIDRMGDVIDQAGWNVKNFLKNPVILWGHNVHEERPPIGKALKVWKGGSNKKSLMFQVKFDLQDSFAAEIFRKVKDGFINTVSVGFLPTEWEELSPKDGPMGGRKYTKQELLELSFVPVPANPEAIVALRSMKDKRFEPIKLEDLYKEEEDVEETIDKEIKDVKEDIESKEVITAPPTDTPVVTPLVETPDESDIVSDTIPKESVDEPVTPIVPEVKPVEELPIDDLPKVDEPKEEVKPEGELNLKDKLDEEVPEAVNSEKDIDVIKGVISFKDTGIAPDTEGWDGPGEIAKAEVPDLKVMCTWFNKEDSENKGAYKLPHHKADDHKAVWRGVAAAMAALLGARDGVEIPETDRKGVYNHLKKHYEQFGKTVPDYKMVEDQVLSKLGEEIQALTLDREDKHVVRLVKKVIRVQKEQKREAGYTADQVEKALELLNLALSYYSKDSRLGGDSK